MSYLKLESINILHQSNNRYRGSVEFKN